MTFSGNRGRLAVSGSWVFWTGAADVRLQQYAQQSQ